MEHRVSLWAKDCSVKSLLDLLAEMNEWKWDYSPKEGVLIYRHTGKQPARLAEVSTSLRTVMPPDYRRYIGLGVLADEWKTDKDRQRDRERGKVPFADAFFMTKKRNERLIANDGQDPMCSVIWEYIPNVLQKQQYYPFAQWTPEIKTKVLWSLLLSAYGRVQGGRDFDVMQGLLMPWENDPVSVKIGLSGLENGEYTMFGFGNQSVDAQGTMTFAGVLWDLKKARAEMSPFLKASFDKY